MEKEPYHAHRPSHWPSHRPAFVCPRHTLEPLRLVATLRRLWKRWNQRHRQRHALAELDDRLLADVGLTRRQAERECRKPPWR